MLGQGIGWALWQQVARDARDRGKAAIELWVLEGNRLGIDWYDRQGGYVVGRREIALADGGHAELRYRFDLKTS
jgi:ribosomal protein S18 acetylase RimI-like enzyme